MLASEGNITVIEVKEDRLMLTRSNDYITVGSKFPRLTKKQPAARLKEIKKFVAVVASPTELQASRFETRESGASAAPIKHGD